MDYHNYSTNPPERKRGQHLGPEERGAIQALKKQGYSVRAISRVIGCAASTVTNELARGTPPRKSKKAKAPVTLRSWERPFTKPTERTAVNPAKLAPAKRSLPG